jgi:hypothetical protein
MKCLDRLARLYLFKSKFCQRFGPTASLTRLGYTDDGGSSYIESWIPVIPTGISIVDSAHGPADFPKNFRQVVLRWEFDLLHQGIHILPAFIPFTVSSCTYWIASR